MAIALDSTAELATLAASPRNWSHTCSGSDRILIVAVMTTPDTVTGVTYNGVALTEIPTRRTAGYVGSLWYLLNPATGTNTVSVTMSGGTGLGHSASFTGVTGGLGATSSGTVGAGSPVNFPITTLGTGSWIVGMIGVDAATTPAAGTGTTIRGTVQVWALADSNGTVSVGANNLQMTYTGGFGAAGYVMVELLASGGAGATRQTLTMMGVGS